MKRSFCHLLLHLLVILALFSAGILPASAEEPAAGALEKVQLVVDAGASRTGRFLMEIQSKSDVAMMMLPKATLMTQITARGAITIDKRHPSDAPGVVARQRYETKVASISFYTEGQPNQDLDKETTRQAFLTSGIPPIGEPIVQLVTPTGRILGVEGVPASFTQFFDVAILEYSPDAVGVGTSWTTSRQIPLAYDLNNPPVWCRYIASFTVLEIDREAKIAVIEARATYKDDAAAAPGPQPSGVSVTGETGGVIRIDLDTGLTTRHELESRSRLEFGSPGNFIAIHQRMLAEQDFTNPEP